MVNRFIDFAVATTRHRGGTHKANTAPSGCRPGSDARSSARACKRHIKFHHPPGAQTTKCGPKSKPHAVYFCERVIAGDGASRAPHVSTKSQNIDIRLWLYACARVGIFGGGGKRADGWEKLVCRAAFIFDKHRRRCGLGGPRVRDICHIYKWHALHATPQNM